MLPAAQPSQVIVFDCLFTTHRPFQMALVRGRARSMGVKFACEICELSCLYEFLGPMWTASG